MKWTALRLTPLRLSHHRGISLIRNSPSPRTRKLAQQKQPAPLGTPEGPRQIPTEGSQGGAVAYERGTPVQGKMRHRDKMPQLHTLNLELYAREAYTLDPEPCLCFSHYKRG